MSDSNKKFAFLRRKARELAATRFSRKELAQTALLKGAHQETIAPLLNDCPVKLLMTGDMLVRAGEPCQALYIVLSGRLQMESSTSTVPATPIRAGDCIGELFLLQKAVVAATVIAAEPTRVLVIDRNIAWTLIRTSPEIARNWLSLLAQRTQITGSVGTNIELRTSHGSQAMHDECTGLYNRHWLEATLPRQIARSASSEEPLGLLLAELDGFADYVAHFGKEAGDLMCRGAAKTILTNVRPTDLVACYGNAQFAIVLPDADIAGACLAAERVRQAVNRAGALISKESGLPAFTASIGATQAQPSADALALLAAAEAALQMAKNSGGNRVGMQ
jgi:diguanylate cyclase (GGDEF)-like protein